MLLNSSHLKSAYIKHRMINLTVPFNKNPDEWHCIHVAMDSVIKHFLKQTLSHSYLNALMNPKPQMWVWPFQAVRVLDDLGLYVKIFSKFSLNIFTNPEEFGKAVPEQYVKITHFPGLKESVYYVSSKGLYEHKTLSLENLEEFLHKGALVILMLGSKSHLGKYVTLTGYNSKSFYYHDSGPTEAKAHKEIPKEKLLELWTNEPSNNMAIVVYGKKFGNTYSRFNF